MNRVPVYILAGGRSRRFGSDKARAEFQGKPLIRHVADALEPISTSITVVADRPDKYTDLSLSTIGDLEPGCGPLGGLHRALRDCDEDWLLLAPCDFVGLHSQWARMLMAAVVPEADAIAFRTDRWEPLPALYHRRVLETVMKRLEDDDRSMQSLMDHVKAVAIKTPPDWPARPGVNTETDLKALADK